MKANKICTLLYFMIMAQLKFKYAVTKNSKRQINYEGFIKKLSLTF